MGKKTDIEWCDSTVNPTGFQCCGCELWNGKKVRRCYAGRFTEGKKGLGAFDKPVELKWGAMAKAASWSDLTGTNRPDKPWLDGRPRVVFVADMADLFQPGVPFEFIHNEVVLAAYTSPHIYMVLTKQAKRMVEFQQWLDGAGVAWPDNLWPGVSVTSNRTAWRVDELLKVDSAHRFVSYEPAWEYVDFSQWTAKGVKDEEGFTGTEPSEKIGLIIAGGESGKEARVFDPQWACDLIALCAVDSVCCFVKQMGGNCVTTNANLHDWPDGTVLNAVGTAFAEARVDFRHVKGGDWMEWPPELRVRQFPECAPAREEGRLL